MRVHLAAAINCSRVGPSACNSVKQQQAAATDNQNPDPMAALLQQISERVQRLFEWRSHHSQEYSSLDSGIQNTCFVRLIRATPGTGVTLE